MHKSCGQELRTRAADSALTTTAHQHRDLQAIGHVHVAGNDASAVLWRNGSRREENQLLAMATMGHNGAESTTQW